MPNSAYTLPEIVKTRTNLNWLNIKNPSSGFVFKRENVELLEEQSIEATPPDFISVPHSGKKIELILSKSLLLDRLQWAALYANLAYSGKTKKLSRDVYGQVEVVQSPRNEMEMMVYIRGPTLTEKRWFNREIHLNPHPNFPEAKVDTILWNQFSLVVSQLKEKIQDAKKHFQNVENPTINFAGHGAGGVYSILAALTWHHEFPTYQFVVYTFGMPRFGDTVLAGLINKAEKSYLKVYRVAYANDVIPTLHKDSQMRHPELEIWINEKNCDCDESSGVFECNGIVKDFNAGDILENQECINQVQSLSREAHYGPYFGYKMGPAPI
ncbi:hypothetical protein G9A89_008959 [Geosiphon pyriformis]|nr:hypothetical protein G9A89_008959 [Geosiphon pyriformis]